MNKIENTPLPIHTTLSPVQKTATPPVQTPVDKIQEASKPSCLSDLWKEIKEIVIFFFNCLLCRGKKKDLTKEQCEKQGLTLLKKNLEKEKLRIDLTPVPSRDIHEILIRAMVTTHQDEAPDAFHFTQVNALELAVAQQKGYKTIDDYIKAIEESPEAKKLKETYLFFDLDYAKAKLFAETFNVNVELHVANAESSKYETLKITPPVSSKNTLHIAGYTVKVEAKWHVAIPENASYKELEAEPPLNPQFAQVKQQILKKLQENYYPKATLFETDLKNQASYRPISLKEFSHNFEWMLKEFITSAKLNVALGGVLFIVDLPQGNKAAEDLKEKTLAFVKEKGFESLETYKASIPASPEHKALPLWLYREAMLLASTLKLPIRFHVMNGKEAYQEINIIPQGVIIKQTSVEIGICQGSFVDFRLFGGVDDKN